MFKVPEKYRITKHPIFASTEKDGNNGAFLVRVENRLTSVEFFCMVSDGYGWEHVSISIQPKTGSKPIRCPSWEEMCAIKDMFWDAEDVVVQFHPRKSDYVNLHNYCLHLWRKTDQDFETPPKQMVG